MAMDPFAAGTQRNSTEEIIVINIVTILMSVKASPYTGCLALHKQAKSQISSIMCRDTNMD